MRQHWTKPKALYAFQEFKRIKSYEYSERKIYHAKGVYYGKTYYVGPLPQGKILIGERREAGPGVHGLHSSPDFHMQSGILCPCMALFFQGLSEGQEKKVPPRTRAWSISVWGPIVCVVEDDLKFVAILVMQSGETAPSPRSWYTEFDWS